MGSPRTPPPVLLFSGLLTSPGIAAAEVEEALLPAFGPVLRRGPSFPFDDSRYYEREMGPGLTRTFLAFAHLLPDGCLPRMKRASNAIERSFTRGGCRGVNIDPGTLTRTRVILATTKESGHRLYLGEGIWGDLHYLLEDGGFRPLQWTYADYRRPEVLEWFAGLREAYRGLLGERGEGQ